jgi:cysteine synthase B
MGVCEMIGHTPLVTLKSPEGLPGVRLLAKLEGSNPGGSVKDRTAWYMVREAEKAGLLTKDRVLLEPTSGNTGIALAMIGASRGYRVKLFMPECVSQERRRILEAYGAEVVLTPAGEGTDGAIRAAHAAVKDEPGRYYMPNQFANPANILAHYETTGPEIWEQTRGEVDAFVAGMGTTGTLMGVGRFLRGKKPSVRIIGVEPVRGHRIQGLKNMQEAIVPEIFQPAKLDRKLTIEDEEAFETTRALARQEGLFVGMSSGAALAGALRIARDMPRGVIVALLPDRGDRYLSTNLFRPLCAQCPP